MTVQAREAKTVTLRNNHFGTLSLALLTVMAAVACGGSGGAAGAPASPGALTPVVVGEQAGTATNLPFIVGINQGFFKQHGVDVKRATVGNAGVALSAVASGSVNVLSQNPTYVAQVDQQGNDLRFFCGNVARNASFLIVPSSSQMRPASQIGLQAAMQQLKGAKLGVPARGGYPELLYTALFKSANMSNPGATYIAVGVGQPALTAFTSGELQSMYAYAFIEQQLVASGKARVLVDMSKDAPPALINSTYVGFVSTGSWLSSNRNAARGYCAGIADSMAWINNPKNAAALDQILSKEFGIDASIRQAAQTTLFPLFDTKIDPTYLQNAVDFGVTSGQIKAQPAITADKIFFKI